MSAWPNRRHAWFAVGVLTLANTLSFADRQVTALLLEPIKSDLKLSDTRMSLLHGLGFVALYALVSLPVARLADLFNRRTVVAVAVLTLSFTTALCSVARSFTSLLTARIGVGASEGAFGPAAQSILSDYLPPQRLALALGFFSAGVYVGGGVALLLGGWLYSFASSLGAVTLPFAGSLYGWRLVLTTLCIPGCFVTLLCLSIHEPARRQGYFPLPSTRVDMSLAAVWQQLLRQKRVYGGVLCGFCLMIMVGAGTSTWIPAFFVRRHHWTLMEIGFRYGTIVLVSGSAGVLCGGLCAATLRQRGLIDANLRVCLFGFTALIPFSVAYPLVSNGWSALWLLAGYNFFAGLPFGGGYAAILEITPNRMRAQVMALFALLVNCVGQGAGPTIIALLTDYVFRDDRALAKSLALTALIVSPLAAACLWYGRTHYRSASAAVATTTPASSQRPIERR